MDLSEAHRLGVVMVVRWFLAHCVGLRHLSVTAWLDGFAALVLPFSMIYRIALI